MRIFLTGSSGFIGSHVADNLLAREHEVFAVHRGTEPPSRLEDCAANPRLTRIANVDLIDASAIRAALNQARPDVVVHAAALGVQRRDRNEEMMALVNVVGSLNLLHACATRVLKRFVWLGTALEYKSQAAPLDETAPLEPLDPYGASKLTAWRSANSFFDREQLPLVTLRLFPVYGPREDVEKLVPFLCKAACKGEALRLERADSVTDYLHVTDAAAAVGHAIEGPLKDGEAYNVASERGVTQRELAEKIFACAGKKPGYAPVEAVPNGLPLIGKAAKLRATGWSPRVDLDAGLKQTFDWYRTRV